MTHTKTLARIVPFTLVLAVVLGTAAPHAAAQTQADFWQASQRTFFLHIQQYCDPAKIEFIDEFDWPNDLDGCGGNVLDPAASWTDVFPSFSPLYGNLTGASTANMHIFVLSRAVDQTAISVTLDIGYGKCEGSQPATLITAERATGYHEFVVDCTFQLSGAADPMARPNLTIKTTATHSYGIGLEGAHASKLTISGVEPAPPKEIKQIFAENERPVVQLESEEEIELVALPETKKADGNSPALDLVAVVASLAAGLVAVRRLRA